MNLAELKEILQLLHEKDIVEFELEEQGMKLRIRKASSQDFPTAVIAAPVTPAAAPPAPATAGSPAPVPPPAPPVEEAGLVQVKSPIVGTFYRAPDPNSAPFVNVGDHVRPGQVLCILEAMKLMNEIEAEAAGTVVKVHPENGQPVQYGDVLFSIRPER